MNNKKATKRALLTSVMALVMCVVMLVGTTFAWFTDTASAGVNKIQAGNLEIELQMKDNNGNWVNAEGETLQFKVNGAIPAEGTQILWEPGCTYELPELRVVNNGNLALKYKVVVSGIQGSAKLNEVIDWTMKLDGADFIMGSEHSLAAKNNDTVDADIFTISGTMDKNAGNEYQKEFIDGINITVYATQDTVENDSFGNTYDANATYYPVIDLAGLKDAVKNGGNVAVDADVQVSGTDTAAQRTIIAKPTTLNLNAKIVSPDNMGNNNTNFCALIVDADTTINAGESGGIDTGTNGGYGINVRNGATLTINGGSYYGGGTAVQVQEGTLTITGGHFAVEAFGEPYGYNFLLNCIDSAYKNGTAKIIVKGGTFVNFNPANCKAEGAGTNFVADGYGVVATPQTNGDVWYTVVEEVAGGKSFTSGATLSTGITATAPNAIAVKAVGAGANVTILDGAFDGGKGGNNQCVHVREGATVTIKGGTFTVGADANGYGNSVIESFDGNIVIEGGFFYTDYAYSNFYYVLNQNNNNPGTITVKGGTFVNYDPSKGDDNLGGNFVADGYKVVSEAHGTDTWYSVVAE